MKKWLRIISLLLIVSLFPLPAFAEQNTDFETALSFLMDLNIERNNEDETYSEDKEITRAEFAVRMIRLMNADAYIQENSQTPFYDVPADYYASGSINALYQYGIVSGYEDGGFHPEAKVNGNEAVTVLLSVLGYKEYANTRGGYPNGYWSIAIEIGLLKGTSFQGTELLTQKNLIMMIYNALFINVYKLDYYGENSRPEIKEGETFLNEVFHLYEAEGTVNATPITGIQGYPKTNIGEIMIGNENYLIGDTDVLDYLGYRVEFIYRYDEGSEDKTLVQIHPHEKKTKIKKVAAKDIISCIDGVFRYEDGKKEKTIRIDKGATIIYNDVAITEMKPDIFMIDAGEIEFISTDGESSYSVIKIKEYKNYVIHSIDTKNNQIYDKYSSGKKLDLQQYERYTLIDLEGKRVEASNLEEWNVLSVLESQDKESAEIIVSNRSVNGSIEQLKRTGEDMFVTVNGSEYQVASSYKNLAEQYLECGKNGTFYLDYNNEIAGAKFTENMQSYGYLISMSEVDYDVDHDFISLKILDSSGKVLRLKTAEKIKINGERNYNAKTARTALTGLEAVQKVILYKLDAFNCVREIVTAGSDKNCGLYKLKSDDTLTYKATQKTFGGQVNMDSDTTVFCVPQTVSSNDLEYSVNTMTFWNESDYAIGAYVFDEESIFADAIVVQVGTSLSAVTSATVVDKISVTIDEDDLPCKKLYGYNTSGAVELLASVDLPELERGDIVIYTQDGLGKINQIRQLFDAETETYVYNTSSGYYTGQSYLQFGKVYRRDGNVVQVTSDEIKPDSTNDSLKLNNYLLSGLPIYKVDKNRKNISPASVNEILDYVHVHDECTKLFAQLVWGNPRLYVLYE